MGTHQGFRRTGSPPEIDAVQSNGQHRRGSDGFHSPVRAEAAGFRGRVFETIAINPALAINNLDVINQWYYNPAYFAIMSDRANTAIRGGRLVGPARLIGSPLPPK